MVNKTTGYTIVGGHQKVSVLDELNKYNEATHEGDYTLRVELIEVDLKTEKELNITLNNHRVGGDWDYDALRELLPDIDYQSVGLTPEDLALIGDNHYLSMDVEDSIAASMSNLYDPTPKPLYSQSVSTFDPVEAEAKKDLMKAVKQQVREEAQAKAEDLNAYVVISFDSFQSKAEFCESFGYDAYDKFIKGEVFVEQLEGIE